MAQLSAAEICLYLYIPFLVMDITVFIRLLYKLFIFNDSRSRKLSKIQLIMHISCFSAVIIAAICDMIHALGSIITQTSLLTNIAWIRTFRVSADIFYYINSVLLYSILVNRVFSTFNETMYEINWYFKLFIIAMISFQSLVMISYCLNLAIFNCDPDIWCKMLGYQSAVITANDYILNGILFILFIRKLRQLIVMRLHSDRSSNINSDHNNKLLNVITKQTLIGISLTLSNQLFATFVFITYTWIDINKWDEYTSFDYLLRGIEGMTVCILLYLGLQINDTEYMKCCKHCHNACFDCCAKTTSQNAKRKMTDYQPMQNDT